MENVDPLKWSPGTNISLKYVASYGLDTSSLCHDLVANCNAAGPVVTIGTVDVSGGSHNATVGQSLVLSCNTAAAQWKKGSVTITSRDASSRVYVMRDSSTSTILMISPFQTTDGGTYTCAYNSTYKTSITLSEWRYC